MSGGLKQKAGEVASHPATIGTTVAGGGLIGIALLLQSFGVLPNYNAKTLSAEDAEEWKKQQAISIQEKIETKQAIQELRIEVARLNTNVEKIAGDNFSRRDFEIWLRAARLENKAAGNPVVFPDADR